VPADAPPAATERIVAVWDSLQAHAHGLYGNFTLESGSAVTERMYSPATLHRLQEIKSRYDPRNVFHRNHNILPL
jgi:FAD/FMN-containing dehydrogenase